MNDQNAISEILLKTNKRFGDLVVTEYFGKNRRIKQIQKVANYLAFREFRKKKNVQIKEFEAKMIKFENQGEMEKAFKALEQLLETEEKEFRLTKIAFGTLVAIPREDAYIFTAFNKEKFRIPEPEIDESLPEEKQGLYQIFEYAFERV